jgi:hypothetical protein
VLPRCTWQRRVSVKGTSLLSSQYAQVPLQGNLHTAQPIILPEGPVLQRTRESGSLSAPACRGTRAARCSRLRRRARCAHCARCAGWRSAIAGSQCGARESRSSLCCAANRKLTSRHMLYRYFDRYPGPGLNGRGTASDGKSRAPPLQSFCT